MGSFWIKTKIHCGEGSLSRLENEAAGVRTALLLTSGSVARAGFADEAEERLARSGARVRRVEGLPSEPTLEHLEELLGETARPAPDLIVALGGGSVVDLAKAYKLFLDAPGLRFEEVALMDRFSKPRPIPKLRTKLVAVPTTSGAGSEVSAASVIRVGEVKYNLVSPELIPATAVLDPRLPRTMPPELARNTGLDALSHAVEAYTTKATTPFSDGMALRAAELVLAELPASVGGDEAARATLHYAATTAGIAFLNARLGLAHAMAHKAAWIAPHGLLVALLLPAVIKANAEASVYAARRYRQLARELGVGQGWESLLARIATLYEELDLPHLRELVSPEEYHRRVPEMARLAYRDPLLDFNPAELGEEEIAEVYRRAYEEGWRQA